MTNFTPESGRPQVLLINDSAPAEVIKDLLEMNGFAVQHFVDGTKALEWLSRNAPVMVISDLAHPGVDGIQVIRWAKKLQPAVPVWVVTGQSVRREEARQAGADRYLTLPFKVEEFVRVLGEAFPQRTIR